MSLIFVVGSGRSGTTLLARILGGNTQAFAFSELHFFEEVSDANELSGALTPDQTLSLLARLLATHEGGYLNRPNPDDYREKALMLSQSLPEDETHTPASIFRNFLLGIAQRHGANFAIEQTPRNMFYAKEILELYPDAKIIEMTRDPRDVLASLKHKWRRGYLAKGNYPIFAAVRAWANYHAMVAANLWVANARCGEGLVTEPRFKRVRYEDLVQSPDATITDVCSFLGLAYEADMLKVQHRGSSALKDSRNTGVAAGSVGSWENGRLNHAEIWICEKIARQWMQKMDYEPVDLRMPYIGIAWSLLTLPIKVMFAVALNMGRVRSARDFIKRRMAR